MSAGFVFPADIDQVGTVEKYRLVISIGGDPVRGHDRLPVAGDPQGLPALLDGAGLLLRLVSHGITVAYQSHAGRGVAREGRPGGQPQGGRH